MDIDYDRRTTLPATFLKRAEAEMGGVVFRAFAEAMSCEPSVSIRLNPYKAPDGAGGGTVVPWCRYGRYLDSRPPFTSDPMMHAGLYYVQEAASMSVHHIISCVATGPVCMLDLCAAPGGKSQAALSALPQGSFLVANDPVRQRAGILCENMAKFGHPGVAVANSDAAGFARGGFSFDIILVDAPCSGEGMFRKDTEAAAMWSEAKVEECAALQRAILEDIWPCLKPGGILVYSTCTYNTAENEGNAAWVAAELGAEPVSIPLPSEWGVLPQLSGRIPFHRFIPGTTRGEGLAVTILRKTADTTAANSRTRACAAEKMGRAVEERLANLLHTPGEYALRRFGNSACAVPQQWLGLAERLHTAARPLSIGVEMELYKGKDTAPSPHLPLSTAYRRGALPEVDTDHRTALAYLRGEALPANGDTRRGFVAATYKGQPIGLAKNVGARLNNAYPREWRIKTTHLKDLETNIIGI